MEDGSKVFGLASNFRRRRGEAQRVRLKSLRGVAGASYGRTAPTVPLRFWPGASGFSGITSAFCSVPSSTLAEAWFFVMSSAPTISCWRLVAADSFLVLEGLVELFRQIFALAVVESEVCFAFLESIVEAAERVLD